MSAEMQQEQPTYYATLASHLSGDEQTILRSVVSQAETQVLMQQQQQQQVANAAAAAAAAAGGVGGSALNGGAS